MTLNKATILKSVLFFQGQLNRWVTNWPLISTSSEHCRAHVTFLTLDQTDKETWHNQQEDNENENDKDKDKDKDEGIENDLVI